MELEDIQGHFWTIKEELETANIRIDELEEKLLELTRKVGKATAILYKRSKSPGEKIANRHMRRIERVKNRLQALLKGVWVEWSYPLNQWLTTNHKEWSYHDLYLKLETLRTWELDELSAIMGIEE